MDTICLTHRDFIETIRAVLEVVKGKREIDDIDHLGNRRVRSVGELLENQLSAGLSRMVQGHQGPDVDAATAKSSTWRRS